VGGKLAELRERNTLAGEQAFHPIGMAATVASGEQEFAMHLPAIFLDGRRDVHDTPHPLLAAFCTNEHRHQLPGIEPVRLRASTASIHFDARGVNDTVGDAAAREIAMQPETVTAGLVTAAHRRCRRET